MLCMIEAPIAEPVSLDEAKRWLKVETEDENEIILTLITSARLYIEQATQRLLLQQSWRVIFSDLDARGAYLIPLSPVLRLLALTLRYSDDSEAALSVANVRLTKHGDDTSLLIPQSYRIMLINDARFELDVSLGYGPNAQDVPAPLRTALLMLVAFWYENRGDYSTYVNLTQIPSAIAALLTPFKRVRLTCRMSH